MDPGPEDSLTDRLSFAGIQNSFGAENDKQ